jgi:hypothetical protein
MSKIDDMAKTFVEGKDDGEEPKLIKSLIDEAAEADQKRRDEYNDLYGEPNKPGGIMSAAQRTGEEPIPAAASSLGELNLAIEQQKMKAAAEAAEAPPA